MISQLTELEVQQLSAVLRHEAEAASSDAAARDHREALLERQIADLARANVFLSVFGFTCLMLFLVSLPFVFMAIQ